MGRFLWGAFLGTVAGSVTALMMAKKTGRAFRADLSKKYDQAKITADHLINEYSDSKLDLFRKATDLANDASEAAKKFLKEAKSGSRSQKKRNRPNQKRSQKKR